MAKILIADDDPTMLSLFNKILLSKGYDVQLAENGEVAEKLLRAESFDLVVSDIKMEPVDGMQLLRNTRDMRPSVGMIMLTAYATAATAIESMQEGAFDYIPKPFRIDDLLETVKRALNYQQALTKETLPSELTASCEENTEVQTPAFDNEFGKGKALKAFLRAAEKEYLESVIDAFDGDRIAAAKELDICLATPYTKLPKADNE